jgi:multidrug efflux pump subunit AcrA (membrane-fusion protein)
VSLIAFVVPIEPFASVPAVVEYDPPTILRASADGFVTEVHVADGQFVTANQPIATLQNDQLELRLSALDTSLAHAKQRARSGRWTQESSKVRDAEAQAIALQQQRDELVRQLDELVVRAPRDGRVVGRRVHQLVGVYLKQGAEIAAIGEENRKRLKISLNQTDASSSDVWVDSLLQARADGLEPWTIRISQMDSRATRIPAAPALLAVNGGPLSVEQTKEGGFEWCEPRVSALAQVSEHQSLQIRCGQSCGVTLGVNRKTIGTAVQQYLVDLFPYISPCVLRQRQSRRTGVRTRTIGSPRCRGCTITPLNRWPDAKRAIGR